MEVWVRYFPVGSRGLSMRKSLTPAKMAPETVRFPEPSTRTSPTLPEATKTSPVPSVLITAVARTVVLFLAHRAMPSSTEASTAAKRALELDPLNVANRALSAQIAFVGRDYSNAVQFAEQAIAIDPEFWISYFQLGQAHEQLGNTDLAQEALVNSARLSGGNSKTIALRGHIFAKLGKTEDARGVLSLLEAASRKRYVPPYAMALVHAGLRENNLALLTVDPKWDAFRADLRFVDLLGRCAFANPPLVAPLDS
jgi:tetratricopeptide (TPR) repeat protein